MKRARRSFIGVGLVVVVSFALASCQPPFKGTKSGPVQYGVLTSNGETFDYSGDSTTVSASAPTTNHEGNIRQAFWQKGAYWLADQQSCVTWDTTAVMVPGGSVQPGIAMRIAPSGANGEGVKAVTVTENIVYAAVWMFWVDVWDSTDAAAYHGVQSFDLSPIVGKFVVDSDGFHSTLLPGPWHICARTQGLAFSFKVWTGDNPEPPWTDPDHVFTTTLPDGWDYPGYSGGYAGHVRAGQTMTFSGQTSSPLCLEPDMTPTQYCQSQIDDGGSSTTTSTAPSTTSAAPPATTTASSSTSSPPITTVTSTFSTTVP